MLGLTKQQTLNEKYSLRDERVRALFLVLYDISWVSDETHPMIDADRDLMVALIKHDSALDRLAQSLNIGINNEIKNTKSTGVLHSPLAPAGQRQGA